MSTFACEHCGKVIEDTPTGYITACEHYPPEPRGGTSERDAGRRAIAFDLIIAAARYYRDREQTPPS